MANTRFFDCFSGIGGFRLGAIWAGWEPVGYCEKDPSARKFYRKFFKPKGEFVSDDITTIDIDTIPDFDALLFGAPCQPFSHAGKRGGMSDDRGRPLWEALFRLLRAKSPAHFVMEEVRGILTSNGGRDWAWILCQFSTLGYDCEWCLHDWRDYNIPQARERLFLVGHLRGVSRSEVFPFRPEKTELYHPPEREAPVVHGPASPTIITHPNNASPTIIAGYWKRGATLPYLMTHSGNDVTLSEENATPVMAAQYHAQTIMSPKVVLKKDRPYLYLNAHTKGNIRDTTLSSSVESGLECSPSKQLTVTMDDQIRMFTPKEVFRLQGFPEDFIEFMLRRGFPDSSLYRFAGNAVSPYPVYAIARRLLKCQSDF